MSCSSLLVGNFLCHYERILILVSHNVDLITFDFAITVEFMIAISLTIEIVLSDIAGFDMFLSSGFFFLGAANEIFH